MAGYFFISFLSVGYAGEIFYCADTENPPQKDEHQYQDSEPQPKLVGPLCAVILMLLAVSLQLLCFQIGKIVFSIFHNLVFFISFVFKTYPTQIRFN